MWEVIAELADGTRYSTLKATSLYHAAVLFYAYTAAPPPGADPPRIYMDALLEVRPIYKVRLMDAMKWANEEAERQLRKRQGK
jgi:hypothetical protein